MYVGVLWFRTGRLDLCEYLLYMEICYCDSFECLMIIYLLCDCMNNTTVCWSDLACFVLQIKLYNWQKD